MLTSRLWVNLRDVLAATVLALLALAVPVRGADFEGTLYFTTLVPGVDDAGNRANVFKVGFEYNMGAMPILGNPLKTPLTGIANTTTGADGLVFFQDAAGERHLAVAGETSRVYDINPNLFNPNPIASVGTGGPSAFHMMTAPNGTIWSSGLGTSFPSDLVSYGTMLSPGTPHPIIAGPDRQIAQIAWPTTDSSMAFYTTGGVAGFGNFGRIDLNTFTTERLLTNLPAARGMVFDPRTGKLILVGSGHVTQIDPSKPTEIFSDLNLSGMGFHQFDQLAVDGHGHVFIADNFGHLVFLDISVSRAVGSPDLLSIQQVGHDLRFDDFAPLVGPGSPPPEVPEPGALVLLGVGGLVLLGYGWRRRQRAA
jgi:hypothetical protein